MKIYENGSSLPLPSIANVMEEIMELRISKAGVTL